MSERSLEFVRNNEPLGCFGADVQALTRVNQDRVNAALQAADLYHPDFGVALERDLAYDQAMIDAGLTVRFEEILPPPEGPNRSGQALDTSDTALEHRLRTLREASRWDDHEGILLAYPCQREFDPDSTPFLHFVAAIEPQEEGAELTVMDPSELPGFGGVFHRSEEEVRRMLRPSLEMGGIPVSAFVVKLDVLPPVPEEPRLLAAEAELGFDNSPAAASASNLQLLVAA